MPFYNALLFKGIFIYPMTYADKLKDPRWQKKRLEIMSRDNFKCQMCGDEKETLHVHHQKYSGDPWEADDDHLITLCHHCHLISEMYKIDSSYHLLSVSKVPFSKVIIINTLFTVGNSDKVLLSTYEYSKDTGSIAFMAAFDRAIAEDMVALYKNYDQSTNL
jgi:hypothetical protein